MLSDLADPSHHCCSHICVDHTYPPQLPALTLPCYCHPMATQTHTMFGPDEVLTDFIGSDPNAHGIVPRASDHLFEGLRHGSQESSFIVQCSYLEVYNNTLNDLLGGKQNLPMREKPGSGLVVEGLTYEMVASSREVMANLARGNSKRVVAAMKMNARSSRGHAIFTIYVKEILAYGGEKVGKLNLVDLAGMESSKKSYAVEGPSNNEMRKVEAKNINTSLYALGSVIERLSAASQPGGTKAHIPYRDSKLTRLLQDSLGGNSKSTIIVALRIEAQNIEESVNTLRFAQRAKAVKTIVKDNTITVKNTDKLVKEIDQMKAEMETAELMVRQLQQELAQRSADEEARLEEAKQRAALSGDDGSGVASSAELHALREEVAVLRHKNQKLLHHKILHRVLKAQTEKAFIDLREANSDAMRQLSEAEEVIILKEQANRKLASRTEELERVIVALQAGQPIPAGIVLPKVSDSDHADDWREDMITQAENELKAAMAAGDAERLKVAIANASSTVAKARARGSTVLKKQHVLHGDGSSNVDSVSHGAYDSSSSMTSGDARVADSGADELLSEEERRYVKFHEVATARKLTLASRGYEVMNTFIDELYDAANNATVPEKEWGEFLRIQLPSPRSAEDGDKGMMVASELGIRDADASLAPAGDETDDEAHGGVHKVRNAVKKVANLMGWRARLGGMVKSNAVIAAAPLMERPDDMPLGEGPLVTAAEVLHMGDPHAGKSLHMEASDAILNVANTHLTLMHLSEPESAVDGISDPLEPSVGEESRAQRYNQRLRERMDARDAQYKPSSRPDEC
mmetsp:Transcript_52351/g.135679  ORF Transcript_52351/g.135679 Transcript_52351/m.135679 type:complete len:804 (+) Transcript_52351:124-2535(+)